MALMFYPRSARYQSVLASPDEIADDRYRHTVEIRHGWLSISTGASVAWQLDRFAGALVGYDPETRTMVLQFHEMSHPEIYTLQQLSTGFSRLWLRRVIRATGITDPQEIESFHWNESNWHLTLENIDVPTAVSV